MLWKERGGSAPIIVPQKPDTYETSLSSGDLPKRLNSFIIVTAVVCQTAHANNLVPGSDSSSKSGAAGNPRMAERLQPPRLRNSWVLFDRFRGSSQVQRFVCRGNSQVHSWGRASWIAMQVSTSLLHYAACYTTDCCICMIFWYSTASQCDVQFQIWGICHISCPL